MEMRLKRSAQLRVGNEASHREVDPPIEVNFDECTVAPRNTGSQGTNKFHLSLADFRYCQYRELKEMT